MKNENCSTKTNYGKKIAHFIAFVQKRYSYDLKKNNYEFKSLISFTYEKHCCSYVNNYFALPNLEISTITCPSVTINQNFCALAALQRLQFQGFDDSPLPNDKLRYLRRKNSRRIAHI